MPIYLYKCEKCGDKVDMIQNLVGGLPLCCGKAMKQLPTAPALIRIMGTGGTRTYSKGYKEGYSKEYLKDVPPFEPKA